MLMCSNRDGTGTEGSEGAVRGPCGSRVAHRTRPVSGDGSFKKTELRLGSDALRMWAGNAMQEERSDHASPHRFTIQCEQNAR